MDKRILWAVAGIVLLCCAAVCCVGALGYLYFTSTQGGSADVPPATSAPVTEAAVEPPTLPASGMPTETPTEAPIAACPTSMETVIASVQYSVYNYEGEEWSSEDEPESITLVTYAVNGDQISNPQYEEVSGSFESLQNDTDSHLLAWDLFTQLIPAENRAVVSDYIVFSDGPSNVLAAVEQSYTDPDQWIVEVDNADLEDRLGLYFTLVHEFGHLLTLGPDQVPPDIEVYNDPENAELYDSKVAACPNYFPGEGCSLPDSYINAFYNRYWTRLVDEWQPIDDLGYTDDLETYYDELYTFYENHEDEFVDDYAATNSSEDIAESFAYFIFSPKPTGNSVAEQKMLFFYEYPELVQLRAEILQSFCGIAQ
jgi:hypothetical protein